MPRRRRSFLPGFQLACPERDDRAPLARTRTAARACLHYPRLSPAHRPQYSKPVKSTPATSSARANSVARVDSIRPQRAFLSLTLTPGSSHVVSRSGGPSEPPNARPARANHGLRTSHLSKLTPQNGQKATKWPKRYWLAICMPSLDLQLGHFVRSRYSNAPAMLATPRAPTAAST